MTDALRSSIRDFMLENYLFTNDVSASASTIRCWDAASWTRPGMLEVIFFIEEKLGVKVKDEEMVPDNLDSVNKIARFVEARRQAA